MWETFGRAIALALMLNLFTPAVWAISPQDKLQYTVTGVEVDVTAQDAAKARVKAIEEAQIKAFGVLATRLGGESGGAIMATLPPAEIGRLMASLSVEDERSAPGRYIGKLSITFLPEKVRAAFLAKGVGLPEKRVEPILLIPVWLPKGAEPVIWDDNPWRRAVVKLDLAGGRVPFRLALGDTDDWAAFSTPAEATAQAVAPLLTRYQAAAAVLMVAEQDANGIHVHLAAFPGLAGLAFDKTYPPGEASLAQAAGEVADAIAQSWNPDAPATPLAAVVPTPPAEAATPAAPALPSQSLEAMLVFTSPEGLATTRKNLLTAPGVQGMDLVQVMVGGGLVQVKYTGSMQELQLALGSRGLELVELSSGWTIRPY